jgi:hypothetical protein
MQLPITFQPKTHHIFAQETKIGRNASALSILYILCGRVFHILVQVRDGTSVEYDWRALFIRVEIKPICKLLKMPVQRFHINGRKSL